MSEVKVHIATSKIWPYFQVNRTRLCQNEDLIAENKKTGNKMFLSTYGTYPYFVVYDKNNNEMVRRVTCSAEECSKSAVAMIGRHILDIKTEEKGEPEKKEPEPVPEDEQQKIDDTIYQREDELTLAMADFLAVAAGEDDAATVIEAYGIKMVNDAVEHFLQYLYDEHRLSIYRPTLLKNEEGEEEYCEFPYGWYDE